MLPSQNRKQSCSTQRHLHPWGIFVSRNKRHHVQKDFRELKILSLSSEQRETKELNQRYQRLRWRLENAIVEKAPAFESQRIQNSPSPYTIVIGVPADISESSITAPTTMASKFRSESTRMTIPSPTMDQDGEFERARNNSRKRIRESACKNAVSERPLRKSERASTRRPKYDDNTGGGSFPTRVSYTE